MCTAAMIQDALIWSLAQTLCGAPGEPMAKPSIQFVPCSVACSTSAIGKIGTTAALDYLVNGGYRPRAWSIGSSVTLGAMGPRLPHCPKQAPDAPCGITSSGVSCCRGLPVTHFAGQCYDNVDFATGCDRYCDRIETETG